MFERLCFGLDYYLQPLRMWHMVGGSSMPINHCLHYIRNMKYYTCGNFNTSMMHWFALSPHNMKGNLTINLETAISTKLIRQKNNAQNFITPKNQRAKLWTIFHPARTIQCAVKDDIIFETVENPLSTNHGFGRRVEADVAFITTILIIPCGGRFGWTGFGRGGTHSELESKWGKWICVWVILKDE